MTDHKGPRKLTLKFGKSIKDTDIDLWRRIASEVGAMVGDDIKMPTRRGHVVHRGRPAFWIYHRAATEPPTSHMYVTYDLSEIEGLIARSAAVAEQQGLPPPPPVPEVQMQGQPQ